jgi:hypothetical protein
MHPLTRERIWSAVLAVLATVGTIWFIMALFLKGVGA